MIQNKVKFIYAFPLDSNRRIFYIEKGRKNYPEIEYIRDKINYWEKLWDEKNNQHKILKTISDLTKSIPDRSLECFVVGGGINPMSTPFIMPILGRDGERTDEQFIDTMIHELLHIFVSGQKNYFKFVREKYENESVSTQNHIIIYAFLEKIFKDLFNSKPLDYSRTDMPEGYNRAIEIVKEVDSENLIEEYYNNLF